MDGLPRGIPAASLKPPHDVDLAPLVHRLPRGIPAASLKRDGRRPVDAADVDASSAGNTRGLIEARPRRPCPPGRLGVFRGEYPRPH